VNEIWLPLATGLITKVTEDGQRMKRNVFFFLSSPSVSIPRFCGRKGQYLVTVSYSYTLYKFPLYALILLAITRIAHWISIFSNFLCSPQFSFMISCPYTSPSTGSGLLTADSTTKYVSVELATRPFAFLIPPVGCG